MNTGGGLFRDSFHILGQFRVFIKHNVGQVTAIIQNHVQGTISCAEEERLLNAPIGFFDGLAFPGKNTNAGCGNGSSCMILCRENVAGAPFYFRAQSHEGFDEYGRLNRHVQATGNPSAFEGLGGTVLGTNGHETGHFCFGEADLFTAPFGQGDIGYFIRKTKINLDGVGRHEMSVWFTARKVSVLVRKNPTRWAIHSMGQPMM